MAALITGHLDDSWLRAVRRWTMFSWLFLSLGLSLGMIWAYEELGWGGYWGWDPVENAGLLPWFTATAFLHSVMVQERRGMLRVWNVTLVILTFFLTIFGTFMTRSGVVQSVHAFGEDPELARMFTIFMVAILVFSFGFVIYRLPLLRARNELDSWVSREAAFLVNNWILLFSAFFVLFATMFPTLSEAVTGERLTVGPPFFNKWMLPIGLVLLLLTGHRARCSRGASRRWSTCAISSCSRLRRPSSSAVRLSRSVSASGPRASASRCAASWSARSRRSSGAAPASGRTPPEPTCSRRSSGLSDATSAATAATSCTSAIVLMFLGFAGEGFKQDEQALLKPGQQVQVGDFTVRLDAVRVTDDGQKQMITAQRPSSATARKSPGCIRRSGSSGSTKISRPLRSRFARRSRKISMS